MDTGGNTNSNAVPAATEPAANTPTLAPAASPPPPAATGNTEEKPHLRPLRSLIPPLLDRTQRKEALAILAKNREHYPDLAPTLWHSTGVIAALLHEIVSMYPLLSSAQLPSGGSDTVCNALALLQVLASHPHTRALFLHAHLPLYLYPFLGATNMRTKPYEYLRLTSLGVMGALVKSDDPDVIKFLLHTEIIPLCLRIMETGHELSRTVATFIVQKTVIFDIGISYVCATPERFYTVARVLGNMVKAPLSSRLLKHVIRCYLRLADHPRACDALRTCLPEQLRNDTFAAQVGEDPTMARWLDTLLQRVSGESQAKTPAAAP
eukprot:TRINITY_DN68213_c0_g1_i1.p1 TRINITY_DN68213_c0_g1~~TRINITY_DN68213_c0_g1_i1.p1  ORF type:complete len:322 (+),score=59.48 TRINITY_DN68213_c0_g1_i1:149-1114(+)